MTEEESGSGFGSELGIITIVMVFSLFLPLEIKHKKKNLWIINSSVGAHVKLMSLGLSR